MNQRQESINVNTLPSLFIKQPYLAILQKESWVDYIELLAQLYDFIEENDQQVAYEAIKILVQKYFRNKGHQSLDGKVGQFILMCIEELKVLRDFHNADGRRMIEPTRSGRKLLAMVEELLAERVKYSGTGAETLLNSLNEALLSQQGFDQESAEKHHQEKIKSYKDDLQLIKKKGMSFAQLLPVTHSTEALFSQAEGAALDILSAVEDVKQSIENERKALAKNYLEESISSGRSLNAVSEFYQQLYQTGPHKSYVQAKSIFSQIGIFAKMYSNKNIVKILKELEHQEKLEKDLLKRSPLNSFQRQFEVADSAIQEKIRGQLELLQLQVRYSLATDVRGLQSLLKGTLQSLFSLKEKAQDFFQKESITLNQKQLTLAQIQLFPFEVSEPIDESLLEENLADDERLRLIESLLQAEETTLKQIVENFKTQLDKTKELNLRDYSFSYGLAEYYVLSAIELFADDIEKEEIENKDLTLNLKQHSVVIRDAQCFKYFYRSPDGTYTTH